MTASKKVSAANAVPQEDARNNTAADIADEVVVTANTVRNYVPSARKA